MKDQELNIYTSTYMHAYKHIRIHMHIYVYCVYVYIQGMAIKFKNLPPRTSVGSSVQLGKVS